MSQYTSRNGTSATLNASAKASSKLLKLRQAQGDKKNRPQTSPPTKKVVQLPLGLPLDDIGNGQRFAKQHGHKVRYCTEWKAWLVYDGQRWTKDVSGEIERLAKATARLIIQEAKAEENDDRRNALLKHAYGTSRRAKREAMVKDAESEPGIAITPAELDTDKYLLNVINGTLDLRTKKLRPHSPDDHITKLAPVVYYPDATCPLFLDFLDKLFAGNRQLIQCVQRVLGMALTGDTKEQVFFILIGGGSNGKTTLLQIILRILGDYALEIEPHTIMVRNQERMAVDIADLYNVRFVVTSESNDTQRLDEAKVKKMTGGERLTGERKFEHPFSFWPQFKLFLATNHLPAIRGTDEAIWRRVMPIPFNVCFWKQGEGSGPQHLKADTSISERLQSESSGILNWLVEGCLEWQRDGLMWPDEVLSKKANYRAEQDMLKRFLEDCSNTGPQYHVTARALYIAYQTWCEANGEQALTATKLGALLRERGFVPLHTSKARGWGGLGLKTDLE